MEKRINKIFSVHYNVEDDVLTIYDSKNKTQDTLEFNDIFNIGMDKEGSVSSIEIFDASKFLSLNEAISSDFLSSVDKAKVLQSEYRNNSFLLFELIGLKKSIERQLPMFNKNSYESPMLAVC